jgi:hypothetical protein
VPVALRQTIAPSLAWLHEPHPQRLVRTHKMVVRAPPLQMSQQVRGLLRSGPGPSGESCHAMANGEIHALNESGIESSREAEVL